MQKLIMIPKEQYEKMLETYDKVIEELEALKNEIKKFSFKKEIKNLN